jgi:hypothetical protein
VLERSATVALLAERQRLMKFMRSNKITTELRHELDAPAGRVHLVGAADVAPASTIVMLLMKDGDSSVGFRIVTTYLNV